MQFSPWTVVQRLVFGIVKMLQNFEGYHSGETIFNRLEFGKLGKTNMLTTDKLWVAHSRNTLLANCTAKLQLPTKLSGFMPNPA